MRNYTEKTVTELFLDDAIRLDASAEPVYGTGQAYVCRPAVFPTVSLELLSTPELTGIVDSIRMAKGCIPMGGRDATGRCDCDGWYDFYIGLNGYTETKLDSCIECVVCNADSHDDGDTYCIDLSREEQQIIYGLLDVQCMAAFGKGCEGLLEEAWEGAAGMDEDYNTDEGMQDGRIG